jgi:L-threonylcarbamoyladenylate synthase
MIPFQKNVIDSLISGGIGIIPTDTIYGIVGRAEVQHAVERIYRVRNRSTHKPNIILISSYDDIRKFNVDLSDTLQSSIKSASFWPGSVSIILPCNDSSFEYLTRGTESIAFRMPNIPELSDLIKKTGPLIAPSANMEGDTPAHTITEARIIFGDTVDFYVDGGELYSPPSKIIKFDGVHMTVIRE